MAKKQMKKAEPIVPEVIDTSIIVPLAPGLELRFLRIAELKEQDINAQGMEPFKFDRLTENIREAGFIESLPYCYDPGNGAAVEIVSGHHRSRSARNAGLDVIPCLVQTTKMTRSELASKQIAHNALVGSTDQETLAELLKSVQQNVDDMLRTGLTEAELPTVGTVTMPLQQPAAAFDFRTITFTFLPHQMERFERVVESLPGSDLTGVADMAQFEAFTKAVADFIRVKNVRHVGTALSMLTDVALALVEDHVDEAD